jgi:hypothetical protein
MVLHHAALSLCDSNKGRIQQFRCNYMLCEISVSTQEHEYDGCQVTLPAARAEPQMRPIVASINRQI